MLNFFIANAKLVTTYPYAQVFDFVLVIKNATCCIFTMDTLNPPSLLSFKVQIIVSILEGFLLAPIVDFYFFV